MKRLTEEEIVGSSAYKMLESMIQDKVDELVSCQKALDARIKQAKKPSYMKQVYPLMENGRSHDYNAKPTYEEVFYTPTFETGVSFDKDKNGNEREIKLKYETRSLKLVKDLIEEIIKLEEQIGDLNREKLYLIAPDSDWQDNERRYNRVFGKVKK